MSNVIGIDPTEVVLAADVALGKSPHRLGTIARHTTDLGANLCYKWMQYSEEAAAVDGVAFEVAYYVSATGYKNNLATSDLSASDEVGAGVLQANMSDGDQGWFQIRGPATLSIALTAGADGDQLDPTGATDGTLDVKASFGAVSCAIAADISAQEIICNFVE